MPDNPITLDEAKTHLRIRNSGFDEEVLQKLEAATEFCEGHVSRTFRTSHQRTLALDSWWCGELGLPNPPLLTVDAINYWLDDVDELLDDELYRTILNEVGVGWIEWVEDASLPEHDTRSDAIRITYTAGYAALPATAKTAILLMLDVYWGDAKGKDLQYAERSAMNLLAKVEWGDYA